VGQKLAEFPQAIFSGEVLQEGKKKYNKNNQHIQKGLYRVGKKREEETGGESCTRVAARIFIAGGRG